MADPITLGFGAVTGLLAQLKSAKNMREMQRITERIEEKLGCLGKALMDFRREALNAIEAGRMQTVRDLLDELPRRMGGTEEALIDLRILDKAQGAYVNPLFHRLIDDNKKRSTGDFSHTGTAFIFDALFENNGDKKTTIENVYAEVRVGGETWAVEERASPQDQLHGVRWMKAVAENALRPHEPIDVEGRGRTQKRVYLLTDQIVPDGISQIGGIIHCSAKWSPSASARCTFARSRE